MVKNSQFFRTFWPSCRIALADLDGSIPECAQVCVLHIELHLEALRKIEMAAVHCTNETTPPEGEKGHGSSAYLVQI